MTVSKRFPPIAMGLVLGMLVTGCTMSVHRSSSIVDYLYPDQQEIVEVPDIPRLELPLRIGVAFVLSNEIKSGGEGVFPVSRTGTKVLTEVKKIDLMEKVSENFRQLEFVKSIELIPSAYLKRKGSFENLRQIRTMYGIDVIALLSYDQTQLTHEGTATISYWTLIGAYLVPGEKNDTHTMVDAAVYDIKSRKMLFRAPGISQIKSKATPANLAEKLHEDSIAGFELASADLVESLKIQLDLFQKKVKELPEEYQVVRKPGYTGGGGVDGLYLLFLVAMGGCWLWMRQSGRV